MDKLKSSLKKLILEVVKKDFPGIRYRDINIELDRTKDLSYGDLFSNVGFKIARFTNLSPLETSEKLTASLKANISTRPVLSQCIEKIELKSPGFINFFFSQRFLHKILKEILKEKEFFLFKRKREKLQIEFVSANPTGPLSIAHGRQAAVGDSLANIFEFLGYKVFREYYINDVGVQIEKLAESIWVRYRDFWGEKNKFPEDGYRGDYILDLAKEFYQRYKNKLPCFDENAKKTLAEFGTGQLLKVIKKDLGDFGVRFDVWLSQKKLIQANKVRKVIEELKDKGLVYEKEDAVWFRSTYFGDDKDRVLIKSDGSLTYIACDIAYHKDKFERGFSRVINIWGPDHHGYIARLKAAVKAMGYSEASLVILIVQLTTLYKEGKVVAMSTRMGQLLTLRELIREVGKDATRYFFLRRALDSHLDFDLELAKRKSLDNPVYYLQYAHARIASIMRFARQKNIPLCSWGAAKSASEDILKHLDEKEEILLLRQLCRFPEVVISVAKNFEPNILAVYLEELATQFHRYYTEYRIISEDKNLSLARVLLAIAVKNILKKGLELLGVSAPEKM